MSPLDRTEFSRRSINRQEEDGSWAASSARTSSRVQPAVLRTVETCLRPWTAQMRARTFALGCRTRDYAHPAQKRTNLGKATSKTTHVFDDNFDLIRTQIITRREKKTESKEVRDPSCPDPSRTPSIGSDAPPVFTHLIAGNAH